MSWDKRRKKLQKLLILFLTLRELDIIKNAHNEGKLFVKSFILLKRKKYQMLLINYNKRIL